MTTTSTHETQIVADPTVPAPTEEPAPAAEVPQLPVDEAPALEAPEAPVEEAPAEEATEDKGE